MKKWRNLAKKRVFSQKMFENQTKSITFANDMIESVENRIRQFIKRCDWRWARTYLTCPHEYIVRGNCALSEREFVEFVMAQREYGEFVKWGKYNNQYIYVDGYKYWTMGDTIPNTTIMNRQKLFGEYDQIADRYDELVSDRDTRLQRTIIGDIIKSFKGSIYEIGCGSGQLLDYTNVDRMRYGGVDPSRELIKAFRAKHSGYVVRNKAFEEDGEGYLLHEYTIALFGSASYVMPVYLQRLANNHKRLFLMFYKDYPKLYERSGVHMHYFPHSYEELKFAFQNCKIVAFDEYFVVTTEEINWDDAVRRNQPKETYTQQTLFD